MRLALLRSPQTAHCKTAEISRQCVLLHLSPARGPLASKCTIPAAIEVTIRWNSLSSQAAQAKATNSDSEAGHHIAPAHKELRNGSSKSEREPPASVPQIPGADILAFLALGAPFHCTLSNIGRRTLAPRPPIGLLVDRPHSTAQAKYRFVDGKKQFQSCFVRTHRRAFLIHSGAIEAMRRLKERRRSGVLSRQILSLAQAPSSIARCRRS
jgi:hypothetical protein